MSKLESLKAQLKKLLESSPLEICLPEYPWEGESWNEVVALVVHFVNSNHEVLDDSDPFVDWLERYQFWKTQYKNRL